MSLLRLLTAGKSLVGLKDGGHRYSLARRSLLPKFGSKKNPFRASTLPEDVAGPAEEVSRPVEQPQAINDCGPGVALAPTSDQIAAFTAPISSLPPIGRPRPAKLESSGTDLLGGSIWSALLPWKRKKVETPAIPRFTKWMVQGELSLEGVKVVRNDLSDSDLEIVPAKPTITAPPRPVDGPAPSPVPVENSWDRLAGRMFGVGKT